MVASSATKQASDRGKPKPQGTRPGAYKSRQQSARRDGLRRSRHASTLHAFTVAAAPGSARIGFGWTRPATAQPPTRPAPGHPHRNASDKPDTEHPYLRGRATHTVRQQHGTYRRLLAREPRAGVITESNVEPGRRCVSMPGLLQVQDDRAGRLWWRAETRACGAVDGRLLPVNRRAASDAEPLCGVVPWLQHDRERTALVAWLEDEVLLARVRQGVPGRSDAVPRLHCDQVHPLGEAERVTHRVASGLEGGVGWIDAADQPEVHQDRVVASEEGLPGPEHVAAAGGVVVGVGDHDLAAVCGRRVLQPPGLRRPGRHRVAAACEDLVVVAG